MTREREDMKLLKTDNGCGYFLKEDSGYESLDKLSKEELLRLVNLTLEHEVVEFDDYDEEVIRNQAHRIIYKSVHEKLTELADRRKEFSDEADRLFKDAYEKYSSDEAG